MKVLMISDLEYQGGAATAAHRLAVSLVNANVALTRAVVFPGAGPHASICGTRQVRGGYLSRVLERLENRGLRGGSMKVLRLALDRSSLRDIVEKVQPDVINLHNVHLAGWDANTLKVVCDQVPVVWTLHDMWSFTGRCAYNKGCDKYLSGCDAQCPTADEYPSLHRSRIADAWRAKRRLVSESSRLMAVTPSQWMADAAISGGWPPDRIRTIPYGIDLVQFKAESKFGARRRLGIDAEAYVLIGYLDAGSEGRKGESYFASLVERLPEQLAGRRIEVLLIGRGGVSIGGMRKIHRLGYVGPERLVAALSAADLLFYPSLADNLPLFLIEAAACGLPSIAFEVGGIPEIVQQGRNGWLVQIGDLDRVVDLISTAANDTTLRTFALEARRVAEENFDARMQARGYMDLFAGFQLPNSAPAAASMG